MNFKMIIVLGLMREKKRKTKVNLTFIDPSFMMHMHSHMYTAFCIPQTHSFSQNYTWTSTYTHT